jgi:hypothetical protein
VFQIYVWTLLKKEFKVVIVNFHLKPREFADEGGIIIESSVAKRDHPSLDTLAELGNST